MNDWQRAAFTSKGLQRPMILPKREPPAAKKPQNILQWGEKIRTCKQVRINSLMVEIKGLEPMTSRMWTERSNQLS